MTASLTIELERPTWAAGESVRGHVDVHGIDDRVRDVQVCLEWRVGDETHRLEPLVLPVAQRAIAGRARMSFSRKLPREPITYAGTLLAVEWLVVACIDVAWARDPVVTHAIEVTPPADALPTRTRQVELKGNRPWTRARALLVDEPQPFTEGALLAASLIFSPVVTVPVVGAGALIVSYAAHRRRRRVARDLGEPIAFLTPGDPRLGQPLRVRVAMRPTRALVWIDVSATLLAEESRPRRRDERVARHLLSRTRAVLGSQRDARIGREVFVEGSIDVPAARAPSMAADHHALAWHLVLTIAIDDGKHGTLTLDEDIPVKVVP